MPKQPHIFVFKHNHNRGAFAVLMVLVIYAINQAIFNNRALKQLLLYAVRRYLGPVKTDKNSFNAFTEEKKIIFIKITYVATM